MYYKVELKVDRNSRYNISLDLLERKLKEYSVGFNGVIVYHNSFYEYRFDIKSSYNKVDSKGATGHMTDISIEDDKIYIIFESNNELNLDDKYICYYRAIFDKEELETTYIFAIDLVNVSDTDIPFNNLSKIEEYIND